MAEETATPEPALPDTPALPDVSEVLTWLSVTRPAAVLALLKDPKLSAPLVKAFIGFRADASGYANTLVRSRLAQAASKDEKLAEKLKSLSETSPLPAPVKASPTPPLSPAAKSPAAKSPAKDPAASLRAERDARRRERDEARQALAAAEAARDEAEKIRTALEAERDEAVKQAKKLAERVTRLERQLERAKQTEVRLHKALGEDKVSPPPNAPARASAGPAPPPAEDLWREAVRHLLNRSKWEAALALAEDVLKADSAEPGALEIAAAALESKNEPKAALDYARRLLTVQAGRRDTAAAAETLGRIFRLAATPGAAEPQVRQLVPLLSASDTAGVSAARLMLTRLRGTRPEAHAWLVDFLQKRTALTDLLMPPPGALGPDDTLPLSSHPPVTARQLLEAIDTGKEPRVTAARAALSRLKPEGAARVWAALEQASSSEPSRLLVLRQTPRGPVVVDGSNVAWFDQESLVQGQPRLRHLTAIRRALWARGYFPVVVLTDANLPYYIDDAPSLRQMQQRGELSLVDAGTVADEPLLRQSKLLGAPLVTNDRMTDWDPHGEVVKLRYTISLSGEALLLSEA